MIRHIVALRWAETTPAEERRAILRDLAALLPLVDGALAFRDFANVSPEEPVVHGFRDGFEFLFRDAAARDAYLAHPAHQAVGARIVAATGGPAGVLVIDIAETGR